MKNDKMKTYIWHPCSQMKDYETFKPLKVIKAYGSYLELEDGTKVIDAISSWWCKTLGHNHPRLKSALIEQADKLEHVIGANTVNPTILALSEQLGNLVEGLNKVFYASDGSTAVEIALKMSIHAHKVKGSINKTKFIALKNGYHGETAGALSVSDVGRFKQPYQEMLFKTELIDNIPYVLSEHDPLWSDCTEHWSKIENYLNNLADETAAIIVEPIVQGVAGMMIYSQDFLKKIRTWCNNNDVYLIADEIMTGFGRTGKMMASMHADVIPDFVCLGKGLTAGWLPLSAVLIHEDIYELFYDDYDKNKNFLHSNTHFGNALAVRVALEAINIYQEEKIHLRANYIGNIMLKMMNEIAASTGLINNVRAIGAIVAADLITDNDRRIGLDVFKIACSLGAMLRPLGNTIYWLPPLNIEEETIEHLARITKSALEECKSLNHR